MDTKITLTNNFHNTSSNARLKPITTGRFAAAGYHQLSRRAALRLRRELCAISECTCGDTFGARGGIHLDLITESGDRDRDYIVFVQN